MGFVSTLPARAEISGEFEDSSGEYGEFNEQDEEEATLRYFQYGRFFGLSLGLGFQGVTGNRGTLYRGGFPVLEFKTYYWFDFNFALNLVLANVKHNYSSAATGNVDVNIFRIGLELRYYFDTRDSSAAIAFAGPHLIAGGGVYNKSENFVDFATRGTSGLSAEDSDSAAGFLFGAGLEFPIVLKKSYFGLEGKYHFVSFKDSATNRFLLEGIPDLGGGFFTVTGNIVFTW